MDHADFDVRGQQGQGHRAGGADAGRPRRGDFPAANSQGFGIPKNAKNKKAAWEFIKWALSPEISMRLVKEHGHSSVCRKSVIESEEYRKLNTVGDQDLGKLYLEVLGLRRRARTTWPIAP